MGVGEELLVQARHLLEYQQPVPSQVSLRRAVSTAYYALFHLLVEDASRRWPGSSAAVVAIERAFNHGQMRNFSVQFDQATWRDWKGMVHSIPPILQNVAKAFVFLQAERHTADYSNHEVWSSTDVERIVGMTEAAFQDWIAIRKHPLAGDYLLSMLLGKPR